MSGRVMGSSSAQQTQGPKTSSIHVRGADDPPRRRGSTVGTGGGSSTAGSQWPRCDDRPMPSRLFDRKGGATLPSSSDWARDDSPRRWDRRRFTADSDARTG